MEEYNKNMSLNDIHEVTHDVAVNIYRLRKNGNLDYLTEDEFKEIYKLATKLNRQIDWAILFKNAEGVNK